jgi:hypothetical protein
MARLARRVVRHANFRVILPIMGLQVWLAGLPGLAAAALLGYLSQRHLQRLAVENGHKADLYLDLVTLLHEHNRTMWRRYELKLPSSEPYVPVLLSESDLVRRTELMASPAARAALSFFFGAIIDWRETDERRLDPDPDRASRPGKYPSLPEWFGYRTPGQQGYERAGEAADDRLDDLCEAIRDELNPQKRSATVPLAPLWTRGRRLRLPVRIPSPRNADPVQTAPDSNIRRVPQRARGDPRRGGPPRRDPSPAIRAPR